MLVNDEKMPYDSLRGRINESEPDVASYFRLEVVYSIDMLGLHDDNRSSGRLVELFFNTQLHCSTSFFTNRAFYNNVVCRLLRQWEHPSVIDPMRDTLTILQGGVSSSSSYYAIYISISTSSPLLADIS